VAELRGQHKFGIGVCKFSPNGKLLATVGFEHDQTLALWDWSKISSSTLTSTHYPTAKAMLGSKIYSLAFSEDGSFFVTAGHKQIKFWYLNANGTIPISTPSTPPQQTNTDPLEVDNPFESRSGLGNNSESQKAPRAEPISGHQCVAPAKFIVFSANKACFSAICKTYKDSTFLDVICGKGTTASTVYAVTSQGNLITFNATNRTLEKVVEIKTPKVTSISITDKYLICGGENSVIRLFELSPTLDYVASLPKPNAIGQEIKCVIL